MYSSTLSLTSALNGGAWLTPCTGRITSGKETRYSFCRRLGAPRPVWTGEENVASHRDSIPDRPAHSGSLYRLSNRGQLTKILSTLCMTPIILNFRKIVYIKRFHQRMGSKNVQSMYFSSVTFYSK